MTTALIESADQEDSWFGLIERMKEGAVVPVIGPEILDVTVKTQDGSTAAGRFINSLPRGFVLSIVSNVQLMTAVWYGIFMAQRPR
jgi:hypothetical protein